MKKTIIFDFDGVIHYYKSGWKGATIIPDEPVPAIKEVIAKLRETYKIVILSTRCHEDGGIEAIRDWLVKYDIVVDDIVKEKVPAYLIVDDRAICFNGDAGQLLYKINSYKNWLQDTYKLKVFNLRETSIGCPTVFSGFTFDSLPVKFRLRNGIMTIDVDDKCIMKVKSQFDGVCRIEDFIKVARNNNIEITLGGIYGKND